MTNAEQNNSSEGEEQEGNRARRAREDTVTLLTFLDLLGDLSMVNRNITLYFISSVLQDKDLA